jgi:alkanesulfonate monooxygenase SsuD/methylene tetrahydromethanopterin reductase-like flavin-dependent oxidoreductase (luciferase family)
MAEPQFVGVGLAREASALVPPLGPPVQPEYVRCLARAPAAATERGRRVRFGLSLRPILGTSDSAAQAYAERVLRIRRGGEARRYGDLGVSVFQLSGYRPLDDVTGFADLIAHVRADAYRKALMPA